MREECGWTEVQCSYQCGVLVPRHQLAEHERNVCPQRPMDIKVECSLTKLEAEWKTEKERHEREIRELKECHRREMAAVKDEMAAVRDEIASVRDEMARKDKSNDIGMTILTDIYGTQIREMKQSVVKLTEEMRGEYIYHSEKSFYIMTIWTLLCTQLKTGKPVSDVTSHWLASFSFSFMIRCE